MHDSELITEYLAGSESLREAVRGLGEEQLRARPVPGTWSILEIVCHLTDSEALFAERMKRVLSEDRPPLLFSDPNACVATLAYHERDAAEEVALFEMLRNQMARILRAQPTDAWKRIGVHNLDGEKTLKQLVRKAVDHLEHHLVFVRSKRQMLESSAS